MRAQVLLLVVALAIPGVCVDGSDLTGSPICITDDLRARKSAARMTATLSCEMQGFCDHPINRDDSIPDGDTPISYLTVNFQTLAHDDGSRPAFSRNRAKTAIDALNGCFEPSRIQFDYDHRIVYSTDFHDIEDDWGVVNEFARLYATDHLRSLNIITTYFWCIWQGQRMLCGGAPYIWTHSADDARWGVLMTPHHWTFDTLICHEVGHALGLLHTFGNFWVEPCDPCDEVVGANDHDFTGDFCSDTPPTPVDPWNTQCRNAPGHDPCSGRTWGETDFRNFMAYTPNECHDHFTPQQAGRMRCWMNSDRRGWVSSAAIRPDLDFGPAPLRVEFEGLTSMDAFEWEWDFGDGSTADGKTPTHVYHSPGVYRPHLTVDAVEGVYEADMAREVWVASGAATIGSVEARPGDPLVTVPVRIANSVPVDFITLPLHWDGPTGLTLESVSTAGLLLRYPPEWVDFDPEMERGCLRLSTFDTLAMPPGDTVLLNLEFSVDDDSRTGNHGIGLESYDGCRLEFSTDRGPYTPRAIDGRIFVRSTTTRSAPERRGH